MMRRRFVVATGSPAASEFRRFCSLLIVEVEYDGDVMMSGDFPVTDVIKSVEANDVVLS
ncbi:hypothetical protein F511_14115 [Dorcoceras hygrometricum]|uniref:Uncharacterized protein n=1 Tax=Dorcoceras hygrometricum TaxID=472368 RepID=A0A2Z7B3Q0_9LAMI|nr:hypothetical protein F511_14115 [Dorcoceras hygrometricum]